MIVEREGVLVATDLPYNFGVDSAGGIVGVGRDTALLLSKLDWLYYREAAVPRVSREAAAKLALYNQLKSEIEILDAKFDGEDDLGHCKPAAQAVSSAKDFMFRLTQSNLDMKRPTDLFTDRDGSIRASWEVGARTLELVCPSTDARPYIYFSNEHEYKIAYDTSTSRLGRLFSWLNGLVCEFPR
jgi:hypothetical protein